MKPQSERTLILAGSLFLVGLIIADVLTQHLKQQDPRSDDTSTLITKTESHNDMAQDSGFAVNTPNQKQEETRNNEIQTSGESDSPTDQSKPSHSLAGQGESPAIAIFDLENTPPPPVQPTVKQQDPNFSFEQAGMMGKFQYVDSNIPQTQFNIFYNALTPHGPWFRHANYGTCWIPQESQRSPQWRPYLNGGKWSYTKNGWLWHSDYRWGAYPFHYGRWFHTSKGWAWKPEGDWSTAWVSWRNSGKHCGWAPLPPVQAQVKSNESESNALLVKQNTASFSTPLSEDHYVFMPKHRILDSSLDSKILEAEKARLAYRVSQPADRFSRGKGQQIGNHGVPLNDLLPWIRAAQENQLVKESGKHAGYQQTDRDTTTSVIGAYQALNRNGVALPARSGSLNTTTRTITWPGSSIQTPQQQPVPQAPKSITFSHQDQVNNIRRAEQSYSLPRSPVKRNLPIKAHAR